MNLSEIFSSLVILVLMGTQVGSSLQSNTIDAKNSEVVVEIRTLVTAVETSVVDGTLGLSDIVTGDLYTKNAVKGTSISGKVTLSNENYQVGTANIAGLLLDQEYDGDSDENPYLAATMIYRDPNHRYSRYYYQIAGEIQDESGNHIPVLRGSYHGEGSDDVASLFSDSGNDFVPVVDRQVIGHRSLY